MNAREAAVDLIHRYFHAFNTGDRAGFFALLTDDIQHDINQGGVETGAEEFRRFMERMDRCYREQIEELVIMADETGTRAAAEFKVRGQYLATDEGLPPANGQSYYLPAGAFFTLRGDQVARVTMYYNLQEWLRQVGAKQ